MNILGKFLCMIGIHAWDGHADPDYPPPRCKRCGKWYSRKYVCICTKVCDCQSPATGHFSNECPKHNDRPHPHPNCNAIIHSNGASYR